MEEKSKKVEAIDLKNLCGDLSHWVDQGVFMMNLILTSPFSPDIKLNMKKEHTAWFTFTFEVLRYLIKNYPSIIIVGLGDKSNKAIKEFVTKKHKDIFFECPDPRQDSWNRTKFYGHDVFVKINYILLERKEKEIDWIPMDESKDVEYYLK